MSAAARRFRFRPRYRGVAALAIGTGGAIAGGWLALVDVSLSFPFVTGLFGIGLGALYLLSPTWRLAVTVDDAALSVVSGDRVKFRLPWADVVKVVASPSTRTLFVDGGDPGRSLLVPGDGAPAPYWIEDRAALYDLIVAHVDAAKLREVETLEVAKRAR